MSTLPVTATSRVSLLHYQGRTYMGGGDPAEWRGPGGTPLATPPYSVDQPLGRTFSRWQTGGQFPPGSALYSVAGEPIERMVVLRAAGRTLLYRSFPHMQGFDLETVQIVLGTVRIFGPACRTAGSGSVLYTPATVAIERVLHGGIPAGVGEIEVRQVGGVGGETPLPGIATSADSPPIPLAPGSRVILIVQPGQWPQSGLYAMPPGDYYLLSPHPAERSHIVEDGIVLPLSVRDSATEGLPLADFLAGLADALGGVPPADPSGPRPSPPGPANPPPQNVMPPGVARRE